MSCAGLLLAAGEGKRMGRPKALLELEGRTLLERSLDCLARAGCRPLWAVVRAEEVEEMERLGLQGVEWIPNPRPDLGLGHSLALGLAHALHRPGVAGVVVLLVDQIALEAARLTTLLEAGQHGQRLVASRYADSPGAWGPPVVLPRSVWPELLDRSGPRGARTLLEREAARGNLLWFDWPEGALDWDSGSPPGTEAGK